MLQKNNRNVKFLLNRRAGRVGCGSLRTRTLELFGMLYNILIYNMSISHRWYDIPVPVLVSQAPNIKAVILFFHAGKNIRIFFISSSSVIVDHLSRIDVELFLIVVKLFCQLVSESQFPHEPTDVTDRGHRVQTIDFQPTFGVNFNHDRFEVLICACAYLWSLNLRLSILKFLPFLVPFDIIIIS